MKKHNTHNLCKLLCVLFAVLVCAAVLSITALAAPDSTPPATAVIDNMSSASPWTSPTGSSVSAMRYNSETLRFASDADDTGYIDIRDYDAHIGVPVSVSRTFDAPLNMYDYNALTFFINIIPAENLGGTGVTFVSNYVVTVTAYSGSLSYSHSISVPAGDWFPIAADIGDWNMRSGIDTLTISVTSEISGGAATGASVRTNFRIDALTMMSVRDTSFEDRFLCTEVSAERMSYTFSENEYTITARRASVQGSLELAFSIPGRSGNDDSADLIRITVSDTTGSSLSLIYTYSDGAESSAEAVTIPATGMAVALSFPVENIGDISNLRLVFDGGVPGDIVIYAIEAVKSDAPAGSSALGSVDTCRMLADGSVNIRGQIPSDAVADHINGSVAIYCVPIYGNIDEFVFGHDTGDGETTAPLEPVDVISVTTRFNITIPPAKLPTAYRAMRIAVYLVSDEEKLLIGQTRTVDFSEEAGAKLPSAVGSIMGLYTSRPDASASASVIMTEVVLDELFGTATTGRLYSFGGSIYYFDNDYLSYLDEIIKPSSLSGASCYLRLVDRKDGVTYAITASDEGSFSRLYAAVDYLTQRYSSSDYGFIRGIAIGENCVTDVYSGDDLALDTATALAAVYGVGRANISGFRVMLPIGSTVAGIERPYGYDAAMLLRSVSRALRAFGSVPYYILAESDRPAAMSDTISAQCAHLTETSPAGHFLICTGSGFVHTETQIMHDYIKKYYEVSLKAAVSAFLYDIDSVSAAVGISDFLSMLSMLDTDMYGEALSYAGYEYADTNVPDNSHPLVRTTGNPVSDTGIMGRYSIFDFTDTFDSAGWFSLHASGECSTVRSTNGERALRADSASGGMMMSFANAVDLSEAPVICIDCFADNDGDCDVILYSAAGTFRTSIYVRKFRNSFYLDASGFAGLSGIYGMALIPADSSDGSGSLYISRVSLCSRTVDDGALEALFSTVHSDGGTQEHEERVVEIMAVALLALASGAAVTAILNRKNSDPNITENKSKSKNGKGAHAAWTNTN